MPDIPQ